MNRPIARLNRFFTVLSVTGLLVSTLGFLGTFSATVLAAAPKITSIGAGADHSCALTSAGSVYCWGYNGAGQLGNGTTASSTSPVLVAGLPADITTVGTGYDSTCALTSAGSVYCWGLLAGQSGKYSTTPLLVNGFIGSVVSISVGTDLDCAVTDAGSAYCWGSSGSGQLGNGSYSRSGTPGLVSNLSGVASISAGVDSACAVTNAGSAYCWGSDANGLLGNGANNSGSSMPVAVSNLSGVASISVGSDFACAVTSAGEAYCWGSGVQGGLGTGSPADSYIPVAVKNLSGITSISAGGDHTCAFTSSGSAYCWGVGNFGELGNGSTTSSLTEVPVSNLAGVTSISAGSYHSCALTADGTDYCWGYGGDGELGNLSYDNSSIPAAVIFPQPPTITSPNTASFTFGTDSSFTVTADGSPTPSITETGSLPGGITFTDNGDGTGTLSGTPQSGTEGTYNLSFDAKNKIGDTPQSFTLTINQASQAINFTSSVPTGAVYDSPAYDVSATGGSSGNPVVFSSETSSVCTVSGSTVDFVGVGTCTVDANQAGSVDYTAADQTQQSFNVSKASQTLSFTSSVPTDAVYNGPAYSLAATGGGSGNPVVSSSETPAVCSISNGLVSFVGVGTCTVDANQSGNADYLDAQQAQQSFNVAQAATSLTAVQAQVRMGFLYKYITFNTSLSSGSSAVSGQSVTFTVANQYYTKTCTATTDSQGTASCTVYYNLWQLFLPVPESYSASYAGSQLYLPSSGTAPIKSLWGLF